LCRKYGDGIDRIYYNCLSQGLDFPYISSDGDSFKISFSVGANSAFAQFIRGRSQSLSTLDYIMVIKSLHVRESCTSNDLSRSLQRPPAEAERILGEMESANMIVQKESRFVLSPTLKDDLKSFEPENRQLKMWPEA
jgi:predicted HTH transcriptional regulator